MPSPMQNRTSKGGKPGRTRKFDNPLSRWLEARKQKQKDLEEQAVRLVTNKIEDNSLTLVDKLNSVDFFHSNLPDSVLRDRQLEVERLVEEGKAELAAQIQRPEICTLEWTTRGLVQLLQGDRQHINMDIRPIDEKLMTLVLMFQQFVAHGDEVAAKTTIDALQVGIQDIRCKLPVHQPELAEAFVKENSEYLEKWITLIGFAQRYDHTHNNLINANADVLDAETKQQEKVESIDQRIETEPDFADAFFYIRDNDTREARTKWTKTQREVHMLLVDAKLEDFNINLKVLQSITLENDKMAIKQQMDAIRTCLNRLPNVSDPNLMNKYREAMDAFVREIAASDQRMEETLNTVEELSGALAQLEESAGNVLAKETAQQSADALFAKLQKKVENDNGQTMADHQRRLREQGYLTKAEREELKKQNELKIQAEQKAQQKVRTAERMTVSN